MENKRMEAETKHRMEPKNGEETKILFSDMDGTLLKNDSTVSPETKRVLDRMNEAGHRLVLTSGRPLDSMLEVMETAGLFYPETLLIAYNGSLIYDCTARAPLLSWPVPLDVCREGITEHLENSLDKPRITAAGAQQDLVKYRRFHAAPRPQIICLDAKRRKN